MAESRKKAKSEKERGARNPERTNHKAWKKHPKVPRKRNLTPEQAEATNERAQRRREASAEKARQAEEIDKIRNKYTDALLDTGGPGV